MTLRRLIASALPMLALALSGCGAKQSEPESILPVRPVESLCPAPAVPPAELMKRPVILDFLRLPSTSSPGASSPPSRRSSSTS